MKIEEFTRELEDILQIDSTLTHDTLLEDLEEWDSMAYLGVISFFDMEFSKAVTNTELKTIKTVEELFLLANS